MQEKLNNAEKAVAALERGPIKDMKTLLQEVNTERDLDLDEEENQDRNADTEEEFYQDLQDKGRGQHGFEPIYLCTFPHNFIHHLRNSGEFAEDEFERVVSYLSYREQECRKVLAMAESGNTMAESMKNKLKKKGDACPCCKVC